MMKLKLKLQQKSQKRTKKTKMKDLGFKKLKLVFEQLESLGDSQDELDMSKYNFSKDEEGNVFCIFDLSDGNDTVVVKIKNNTMSFDVSDSLNNSRELKEADFQEVYADEYKNFKKALEEFKGKENEDFPDSDKIYSMSDQLEKFESDEDANVSFTKDIVIGETTFKVNLLNDSALDYCCEIIFQSIDEFSSDITYYKALVDIKEANSMIIQIVGLDEDGNFLDMISASDLLKKNEKIYKKLLEAIKQTEKYIFK